MLRFTITVRDVEEGFTGRIWPHALLGARSLWKAVVSVPGWACCQEGNAVGAWRSPWHRSSACLTPPSHLDDSGWHAEDPSPLPLELLTRLPPELEPPWPCLLLHCSWAHSPHDWNLGPSKRGGSGKCGAHLATATQSNSYCIFPKYLGGRLYSIWYLF